MSEPCLCGAEDCPRCFPELRVKNTDGDCLDPIEDDYADRDPEPEYTSRREANEQADRAAMRWHDERERQAERRGM